MQRKPILLLFILLSFAFSAYATMYPIGPPPPPPKPIINSITVTPATASVPRQSPFKFTAKVEGSGHNYQEVSWDVGGEVSVNTYITSEGILYVAENERATTLNIIATSVSEPTINGWAIATVTIVGTKGPAGGYIFYDKGKLTDGWRYLEAAPVSSEFMAIWGLNGIACPSGGFDIGTGKENTDIIIKTLKDNNQTGCAAQLCAELNINGYTDWFLPSIRELGEMYKVLGRENNLGSFSKEGYSKIIENGNEKTIDDSFPVGYYWSSTAHPNTGTDYAFGPTWCFQFKSRGQSLMPEGHRLLEMRVRAVRAF